MNLNVLLTLDELAFNVKKKFKSPIVLIIILVLVNIIYASVKLEISNEISLYMRIIINVVIVITWILNRCTYIFSLGFKTKRFLVILRFNPNDIKKYDLMKDKFLSKLKENLDKNDIDIKYVESKNNKKEKEIRKLYNKSDSCIVFDVEEASGKIDNILAYTLKIDDAYFKVSANMPEYMVETFKVDINKAIEKFYKITDENSIKDIKKSESLLEIGIMYLASIVYIITAKTEICYKCLTTLEKNINEENFTDIKSYNYIKIQINKRYIELYNIVVKSFFDKRHTKFILENIDKFIDDLYMRSIAIKNNVSKKQYEMSLYNYYALKVIRDYQLHGKEAARKRLNEWYSTGINISHMHLLDNAFLLAHEGKYNESIKSYKRIFKTHNVMGSTITEVLTFIDNDKKGEDDYPNIFCECIINILAADMSVASKDLQILKSNNIELYNLVNNELGYKI